MRVLVEINHPAHVHLFRNVAEKLIKNGSKVVFTTREKEFSHILLKAYGLEYYCFGPHYKTMRGKLWGILKYDWMLWRRARKFKPDVFLSMGSIYASHVAKLIGKPHVMLQDTENAKLQNLLSVPFASVILSPECYHKKLNNKHYKYPGYHELAYLHPNYFTPDTNVLNPLAILPNEKVTLIRFVSWNANHDVGHRGISDAMKIKIVEALSQFSRVFISAESDLPHSLEKFRLHFPPEKIHHLITRANLLFGESATMASEAAMLGVPSIFIDNDGRGYTTELEEKYGLVFNYTESEEDVKKALNKALKIIQEKNSQFQKQREIMLNEKIDVTDMIYSLVTDFPAAIQTKIDANHIWQ